MKKLIKLSRIPNAAIQRFSTLWTATNLALRLPFFFRHPITFEESKAAIRNRIEHRAEIFLSIVRKGIYQYPESPYLKLLKAAACEFSDIEKLANENGVEGALEVLFRNGVYLTVDEFKGRQQVVRGSFSTNVIPDSLFNPLGTSHVLDRSSGSRSPGTPVPFNPAFLRDTAKNSCLAMEAHSSRNWLRAMWLGPGGGEFSGQLKNSCIGSPPVRWFLRAGDPSRQDWSWRLKTRCIRWGSFLGHVKLPKPIFVPHSDPLPIVSWMADVLRAGETPCLWAYASSAVRLCRIAYEAGLDLKGAKLMMSGEPITAARLTSVQRVGAEAIPLYASNETSRIADACLKPDAPDDMHLLSDLHALIQSNTRSQQFPGNALFITSLLPTAPFLLLNVSMGDQAVVTERSCGCPLEGYGWHTHLHTVRSYEKLTAGGLTLLDTDVIQVLEEKLPSRFGGGPTDYQLVEDEIDGEPRLTLIINPAVGEVNMDEVGNAFLAGIRGGKNPIWNSSGFFQVERREPIPTGSGKILHLHIDRRV